METKISESTLALAKAITASAKAYEESFDREEAMRARAEYTDKLSRGSDCGIPMIPDYSNCYKMSLLDACNRESGQLAQPVYLLLQNCWNDALDWADKTAKAFFNQ